MPPSSRAATLPPARWAEIFDERPLAHQGKHSYVSWIVRRILGAGGPLIDAIWSRPNLHGQTMSRYAVRNSVFCHVLLRLFALFCAFRCAFLRLSRDETAEIRQINHPKPRKRIRFRIRSNLGLGGQAERFTGAPRSA
jgi:hypothetical protein